MKMAATTTTPTTNNGRRRDSTEKRQAFNEVATLTSSIGALFYVSKIFGLMPFSITEYSRHKQLKTSVVGNIWCIVCLVHFAFEYHYANSSVLSYENDESGTLTVAIGLFIIYLEPLMMIVDIIMSVLNQRTLIRCLHDISVIDEQLAKEQIEVDFSKMKRVTNSLIALCAFGELNLVFFSFIKFEEGVTLSSLWYLITVFPMFIHSMGQIWYVTLVYSIKQRFHAINVYLMRAQDLFEASKRTHKGSNHNNNRVALHDTMNMEQYNYLKNEMMRQKPDVHKSVQKKGRNKDALGIIEVMPSVHKMGLHLQSNDAHKMTDAFRSTFLSGDNTINFAIGDRMDKRLIMLCQKHDDICEICKVVNKMFSLQMLLNMAFGFMAVTAQFYFLYCGLVGQSIPILFRTAESIFISILFIIYTSFKCVCVIYISWQTKLTSLKTGICLHKIANTVDEDHFYQTINHLSLKFLNHQLSFSACGFFELDMTTLYAITGAITSYLIILIQFNLAAQHKTSSDPRYPNATMVTNITNIKMN